MFNLNYLAAILVATYNNTCDLKCWLLRKEANLSFPVDSDGYDCPDCPFADRCPFDEVEEV